MILVCKFCGQEHVEADDVGRSPAVWGQYEVDRLCGENGGYGLEEARAGKTPKGFVCAICFLVCRSVMASLGSKGRVKELTDKHSSVAALFEESREIVVVELKKNQGQLNSRLSQAILKLVKEKVQALRYQLLTHTHIHHIHIHRIPNKETNTTHTNIHTQPYKHTILQNKQTYIHTYA